MHITANRNRASAVVIDLDSRRPMVLERMMCTFCGTEHLLRHAVSRRVEYHGPCPGCDESASVPLWKLRS